MREELEGGLEGASCMTNSTQVLSTFIDVTFHSMGASHQLLATYPYPVSLHRITQHCNSKFQNGCCWPGQADTGQHVYADSQFPLTVGKPRTNYNIQFYFSSLQCPVDNAVTTRPYGCELFVTVFIYVYTHTCVYRRSIYSQCISFPPFTSPFQCLLITCPFYLFCYVFPVVNPFNKIPRVHL